MKNNTWNWFWIWFLLIFLLVILFTSLLVYPFKEGYSNLKINNNDYSNNSNNNKWSKDLIQRFLQFQRTVGENQRSYNMDVLQKQATADEAEYLLKNGFWYWPDDLKKEYIEKVKKDIIIKIDPKISLENAMKIYSQNAMKELLYWNTNEGQLILYGVDLGQSLVSNLHNTIKCSTDNNGNSVMEKKIYTGVNLWNGQTDYKLTKLNNEDLPMEIPGFSFIGGSCNPCSALDIDKDNDNDKCPFTLKVKKEKWWGK